jgi:hypothetical protein
MRASKVTTRNPQQNSRRLKSLGDLSSVRTWRRRNDDSPRMGRLAERPLSPAAPQPATAEPSRATPAAGQSHAAVGLLQASGLVVLVCAGALAIFAGWGRTDLVQLAAIFAVVGIGLVGASLWRQSSRVDTATPSEKTPRPRVRGREAATLPWAALDQRVQRLVSQLEDAFEK